MPRAHLARANPRPRYRYRVKTIQDRPQEGSSHTGQHIGHEHRTTFAVRRATFTLPDDARDVNATTKGIVGYPLSTPHLNPHVTLNLLAFRKSR
jgi:hypothetical protein